VTGARDAAAFLERHVAEVEPLALDYNEKYWIASRSGRPEDAAASAEAKERLLTVYSRTDEFAEVRRLAALSGHDPLTARQLRLLELEYAARQIDPAVLADMARREEEIEQAFNSYRAVLDGEATSENQLRQLLRTETDPARRRSAWEASKQIGAAVSERLLELVRLRNREARRLGHANFFVMSLAQQELDEATLFALLGRLKELSEGPFGRVKADIDRALGERWGHGAWDSSPWLYADPFFQEAPPGAASVDLDGLFAGQDIEGLTRRTFEPLELPVEHLFTSSDFYERPGKSQHAFCTHIDRRGDVRVLCNVQPNEYWMTTMLHEFGHAVYDHYLDMSLPWILRQPAHTMTTEAVAMLFGRLTRKAPWLARVASVDAAEAASLEADIRRSLAVSQLIFVRWGLLLVHFERELYRDPEQDLDALWWRMAADFQKVRPPEGRKSPDWASKIHLSVAPVYYQNYLLGELTASQLESWLLRELGTDGRPASTFVDEPRAGRLLREKLFHRGARDDWQGTLAHATGAALDPGHWIREFVGTS
jgi:peptidyl-dipeptidase A